MGRRSKILSETKIETVKKCLAGKTTVTQEASLLGVHPMSKQNGFLFINLKGRKANHD